MNEKHDQQATEAHTGAGRQPLFGTGGRPLGGSSLGGLFGWLLRRLRVAAPVPRRLRVIERIALAPRQSLVLVEAEGHRLLIAISSDGTSAFHSLAPAYARPAERRSIAPARLPSPPLPRRLRDRTTRQTW